MEATHIYVPPFLHEFGDRTRLHSLIHLIGALLMFQGLLDWVRLNTRKRALGNFIRRYVDGRISEASSICLGNKKMLHDFRSRMYRLSRSAKFNEY